MLGIILTALIVSLLLFVEHWFPWQLMLRAELPRLAAYVLGVLAIVVPLTGLYISWWIDPGNRVKFGEVIALWAAVCVGGLSVMAAHGIDKLLKRLAHGAEMDELNDLREGK